MKTRDLDELKTSTSQTLYKVLEISISLCTYQDIKCSNESNWKSRSTISKYSIADQFNIQDKQSINNPTARLTSLQKAA